MSGTITRYLRRELSFNPGDTLTVRDYRISMTAQVTAPSALDSYGFNIPVPPGTTMVTRNSVSKSAVSALAAVLGVDYDPTKAAIAGAIRD